MFLNYLDDKLLCQLPTEIWLLIGKYVFEDLKRQMTFIYNASVRGRFKNKPINVWYRRELEFGRRSFIVNRDTQQILFTHYNADRHLS